MYRCCVFMILGLLTLSQFSLAQAYVGSAFNEVREVLLDHSADPQTEEARREVEVYRRGELPRYQVTAGSFVSHGLDLLKQAAIRTVNRSEDYYPRMKKLLHPNGVCFTGSWNITEPSPYTGYFSQGSEALFVGRASVALTKTESGNSRGFGFAGKLFPTKDGNERTPTANFFVVDVLMGTDTSHFARTAMTNEPEVGFDLFLLPLGLRILNTLKQADENPGFRPLYPVSELGLPAGTSARNPHWMRLRPVRETAKARERDFRRELDIPRHHPNGIVLEIAVSDTTKDRSSSAWKTIGNIHLKESMVSYGCDRQLHFAHPKLRP